MRLFQWLVLAVLQYPPSFVLTLNTTNFSTDATTVSSTVESTGAATSKADTSTTTRNAAQCPLANTKWTTCALPLACQPDCHQPMGIPSMCPNPPCTPGCVCVGGYVLRRRVEPKQCIPMAMCSKITGSQAQDEDECVEEDKETLVQSLFCWLVVLILVPVSVCCCIQCRKDSKELRRLTKASNENPPTLSAAAPSTSAPMGDQLSTGSSSHSAIGIESHSAHSARSAPPQSLSVHEDSASAHEKKYAELGIEVVRASHRAKSKPKRIKRFESEDEADQYILLKDLEKGRKKKSGKKRKTKRKKKMSKKRRGTRNKDASPMSLSMTLSMKEPQSPSRLAKSSSPFDTSDLFSFSQTSESPAPMPIVDDLQSFQMNDTGSQAASPNR